MIESPEIVSADAKQIIERMCGYLDDGSIAKFVGCEVTTVERIRSRMPRRTRGRPPRQDQMLATKSNISDRSITAADSATRCAARIGSDALLRRQLETGQHSLTADQFYAVCFAKGWMTPTDEPGARKSAA